MEGTRPSQASAQAPQLSAYGLDVGLGAANLSGIGTHALAGLGGTRGLERVAEPGLFAAQFGFQNATGFGVTGTLIVWPHPRVGHCCSDSSDR